jgi:glycosyltransferase involved in cell wall biosynthesis
MKKVVYVTDRASRFAGGLFESVRGLCKGVATVGSWDWSVLAFADTYSESDRTVWGKHLRLVQPSRYGPIGSARVMLATIRDESPDIVHLHDIWGPATIALRGMLHTSREIPVVVSPHGMLDQWALQRSRIKKSIAWFGWTKAVLSRATFIHALCDEEAESIRKAVQNVPVTVIPNGVTLPGELAGSLGLHQRDVLFLGRIHPKKGLSSLLEAWASIGATGRRGWRLIVAGWDEGGHEAALKSLAGRLGLGDSVIFKGEMFGEQKGRLFRSVAAFILPSLSEGLPMGVLEAWSYGLPVLMTDACHLTEGFAANAAIRIHPTPESIATGLLQLVGGMSDAERETMGKFGRDFVEKSFSWDRIAANMCKTYDHAIE